ncbi:MAG: TSUP family transporter [Devosiaceae bacterium]
MEETLISSLSWVEITVIIFGTLVTSYIHGATGLAGGILLAAILAPIIGVTALVPVMSVTLLISHLSRAVINSRDFHRGVYLLVVVPAVPALIVSTNVYASLSAAWISGILGTVVLISIPYRHWAARKQIKTRKGALVAAGFLHGSLTGVSIGPGMLLVPLMFGYGLTKEAFVATFAAIALTVNITRVSSFGLIGQLPWDFLVLGLLTGLLTIPGNFIGRMSLRRMDTARHSVWVDVLTLIAGANFLWIMAKELLS